MTMDGAAWVGYGVVMTAFSIFFLTCGAVLHRQVQHRVGRWVVWAAFVGQALAPVALVIMYAGSEYAAGRIPRQLGVLYLLFFSSFTWPVFLPIALHAEIPCFFGTGPCQ